MAFVLALLFSLIQSAAPARPDFNRLIDGVNRTYANMKDLSADFVQFDQNPLNRMSQAAGHLYAMKPGMARFEYRSPDESLFVSNGKLVYMYLPAEKQVHRDQLSKALDDRIPLMFLVGRSNLRGEFTQFERLTMTTKPVVEGSEVVRMVPKAKSDLTELLMEVDPSSFLIRRLVISRADRSMVDMRFSNIQTNTGLRPGLFEFKIPPGVQVLEGIGQ